MKLLVSTPKQPQRRYGCSRNQCRRAAHAKAREDLIRELEQAADNRFYEWLGTTDKSMDAKVADLLVGDPMNQPQPAPTAVSVSSNSAANRVRDWAGSFSCFALRVTC